MHSKGVVTTAVVGGFFIISGFLIMGFDSGSPNLPGWERMAIVATTVLLLGLLSFIILVYPRKIIMWEGAFIVRRLCGNKIISHDNIKYIRRVRKDDLERKGNLLGNGNFGGYWGTFATQQNGRFRIYSRNLRNMLLLEMDDGRKYVISYTPKSEHERNLLKRLMEE